MLLVQCYKKGWRHGSLPSNRCYLLCQDHFSEKDIKRNPNCWKLVAAAVPSCNLYSSVTPRLSHRKPRDRSTSQLGNKVHEKACSSTASDSSSTSTSPLSLENTQASDLGTCSKHDYSVSSNRLYQDIVDLRAVCTDKVSEKKLVILKTWPKKKANTAWRICFSFDEVKSRAVS